MVFFQPAFPNRFELAHTRHRTICGLISSLLFVLPTTGSADDSGLPATATAAEPNSPAVSSSTPQTTRRTVLCLGDSLTAGYGLAEPAAQAFPALLQQKIRAAGQRETVVINGGVSGDTTAGGLRRVDWYLRQPIDVLVLALGANDGLRGKPTEEIRRNLQGIIDKVKGKNPAVQLLLVGMRLPPNYGEDYTERFQKVFTDVALANHAAAPPFLLDKVGGVTHLNQRDGVHPTAEGQKIMAETVWNQLRPLLGI